MQGVKGILNVCLCTGVSFVL